MMRDNTRVTTDKSNPITLELFSLFISYIQFFFVFKGIVTSSPFTHPNVFPNMHDFLSSVEHKRRQFNSVLKCLFHVVTMNGD